MQDVKSIRDVSCRPSASLSSILNRRSGRSSHLTIRLPAAHREPASPSGWYTAAMPGPPVSDEPLCTRLDTARPQHIHSVRTAQRTAVNVHVRVDDDVGNDHRANATHPLGEGERLWITQQADVRLIAAQRGEAVDRPFSGSSDSAVFENCATTSGPSAAQPFSPRPGHNAQTGQLSGNARYAASPRSAGDSH